MPGWRRSVRVSSFVTQTAMATKPMAQGVAHEMATAVVPVPATTVPRTRPATRRGRPIRSTVTDGTMLPKPWAHPSRVM